MVRLFHGAPVGTDGAEAPAGEAVGSSARIPAGPQAGPPHTHPREEVPERAPGLGVSRQTPLMQQTSVCALGCQPPAGLARATGEPRPMLGWSCSSHSGSWQAFAPKQGKQQTVFVAMVNSSFLLEIGLLWWLNW